MIDKNKTGFLNRSRFCFRGPYTISAFKSIIFLAATQLGQSQNSAPSALISLACCNKLAAPSSPRIWTASSEPAKPIVSSISAMFC